MEEYLVSIIIPTCGRLEELEKMLESIRKQYYKNIEVIIIDQNFSSLLDELILNYSRHYTIIHEKVSFRALSKAKNYGANIAKGEILCFTDDDASMFDDTIINATKLIDEKKLDGIFGKTVDEEGRNSLGVFENNECFLNESNYWGRCIEPATFFKKDVFDKFGFDETLGVGMFHGAYEGIDLVYRMVRKGISIYYCPNILFYHPQKNNGEYINYDLKRVFTYACGFGKLCMKHPKYKKKYYKRIIKLCISSLCNLIKNRYKARVLFIECAGNIIGAIIDN